MSKNTKHQMGIKEWICLGIIGFFSLMLVISSAVLLFKNFTTGRLIVILILFIIIILLVLTLCFCKIYLLNISAKVPGLIRDHPIILSIITVFLGIIIFLIIENRDVEQGVNFDTLFTFSPTIIGLSVLIGLIPNLKEKQSLKEYQQKIKREKEEDRERSIDYNNVNSEAIQSFANAFGLNDNALPILRSCFGGGGRRCEEKYQGNYNKTQFSVNHEGFLKVLDIIFKTHEIEYKSGIFTVDKGHRIFDNENMTCSVTLKVYIGTPAFVGFHERVLSDKIEKAAKEASYSNAEKEAIVRQLRADYRQELSDAKRADMEIFNRRFKEIWGIVDSLFDNVNLFYLNGRDIFKVTKIMYVKG